MSSACYVCDMLKVNVTFPVNVMFPAHQVNVTFPVKVNVTFPAHQNSESS